MIAQVERTTVRLLAETEPGQVVIEKLRSLHPDLSREEFLLLSARVFALLSTYCRAIRDGIERVQQDPAYRRKLFPPKLVEVP